MLPDDPHVSVLPAPPDVPALPPVVRADDPGAVVTTPREAVQYNRDRASGYSIRRAIFVFGITVFLLVADTVFVAFGYTGELVNKFVDASFSLMGAVVLYYLGAGLIDNSQMLRRIGEGFAHRREDGTPDGDPPRNGDHDRDREQQR